MTGCGMTTNVEHPSNIWRANILIPKLWPKVVTNVPLSGKWHMGASARAQQGFTHWFCHKSGGGPYYGAPLYRDGVLYREERYVTDAITDDAVEFLNSHKEAEKPFYLHVAYTAPHAPWLNNHPEEYTKLYENCLFESVPASAAASGQHLPDG